MIFDDKRLRFITVCAYLNREITILLEKDAIDDGVICVDDSDDKIRNTLLEIQSIMNKKAYTYNGIALLNAKFPKVQKYYDSIYDTIGKHIKAGEQWIPSLVILSILQEFALKGYKCFSHIDFTKIIDKYIEDERSDTIKNLKIAGDVFDTLYSMEIPKNNRKKRKRK